VAIDVTYAAVGLVDIYIRQGLYKERPGLPQPPYVPGLEVAGTIRALGDGVEGFQIAEPVVTLSGTGAEGGYASATVADAAMTVSLDGAGIGPAAAVAAMPNAATAHTALTEVAHLKPGERVLVHGALGGLASAFPGVARPLGAASVTGTARRSSLAAARASALPYDEVIASEDLLTAHGGPRFDVVIDPVDGQVRTDSLKVMAPLGRMLLVGNASSDWRHTVATNDLWLGSPTPLGEAPARGLAAVTLKRTRHMPQGRRGRSGLAAATLMTRADLARLAACARRFLSCSSASRSSVSVSMNNLTNMGCMMVLLPVSRFTPRRAAGRGQGGAARSPGRREGSRPCRRTRSLRCTAGSIPARGNRRQCGRHCGPGGQPGGHGGLV